MSLKCWVSKQMIIGWLRKGQESLVITFVYAKCNQIECRELWLSLEVFKSLVSPWLLAGDFNVICNDGESIGGNPRPLVAMEEFNGCIDSCGLMDLHAVGNYLSWCNGHTGVSRS